MRFNRYTNNTNIRRSNFYRGTSVTPNDGVWHHICVSWESSSGSWKFYKDGEVKEEGTNFKRGHTITQGGSLVLGQEQDSVGGGYDADQSFKGTLLNVNLWDKVLSPTEIEEMSTSCLLNEWNAGNVYKWRHFVRESETRLVKQSTCEPLGTGR